MKTKLYLLIILLTGWAFSSCQKEDELIPTLRSKHTVLIYAAADSDNSINRGILNQIYALQAKADSRLFEENTILVFIDPLRDGSALNPDSNPQLLKLDFDRAGNGFYTIIKRYPEMNSASAETLSDMIRVMTTTYPSDSYGIIMSSHASGWLPMDHATYGRSWGIDTDENGNQTTIELDELAAAMPDDLFDYIVFDACYMGAVEVAYALKNKANYLISAPTETLIAGVPYYDAMEYLFGPKKNLKTFCEIFYQYYSGSYMTVSLIDLGKMDRIASVVSDIVSPRRSTIENLNVSGIQRLDRYNVPVIFDLGHFLRSIATDDEYRRFEATMDEAVLYKAHTRTFVSIAINHFSGMSSYIPLGSRPQLNAFYQQTDWYREVYKW